MSKIKKVLYDEILNNSLKLFESIFGEVLKDELKKKKIKPFNWKGLDIKESAGFPNIKERFSISWAAYFNEDSRNNSLELFIQSIYHYGLEQGELIGEEKLSSKIKDLELMLSMK